MPEEQNKANPNLVTVFCDFFRAIARPGVTIIFAAVIAQVIIERIPVPEWFLAWLSPASPGGSPSGPSPMSRRRKSELASVLL